MIKSCCITAHMDLTGTVNQIISSAGPLVEVLGTGGGGGWYFGCTSLLGNLLRYVLLCVCVVCSVAVSCDPICSRNTEFIVCLLWSFSTSSKRASHPLHTIPYIVLYLRANYAILVREQSTIFQGRKVAP